MINNRLFSSQHISEYTLFAKRIGLVGIARTIYGLRGLIILPILTKTLGASDYGVWAQILVTVSLLQPLIQLGLGSSAVRFLSAKGKRDISRGIVTCLSVTLVTGAIVAILLFLSSDFLASTLLRDTSAATVIKFASPLIILEALNVIALGSFRIFGQIKRYAFMTLLRTFLEIGLIAFFVLSGHGLIGAVISLLITRAVTLVIMLYLVISYAGFAFPDFSLLRPYLAYGLPLIPTTIFEFVIASSDRYVIGFFMGATPVGIYSAAYGIGSIILMFSSYIMYILRPTIYKEYDEGKIDAVKTYLSYSWKYLLMLAIPSVFGLSILAKPLLASLTTSEFISAGKFILPLVASGMILYGVGQIFGVVIMLSKRTKIFAIAFGAAAAMNLSLNIIFVPHWGIIAAAITTLIAYAMVAGIICHKSRQYMKFDVKLDFIVKSILSSVVMTLIIWAINPIGAVKIVLSIITAAVVYFAVLFLLKGFAKAETKFFIQLLKGTVGGIRIR